MSDQPLTDDEIAQRRALWHQCPLGWFEGRLTRTRLTTDADVIEWLQKVKDVLAPEED